MVLQEMSQDTHNAFPFETSNPSGVPGITEIEGRVIAAIVGHVADRIEGVVNIGRGGLVRAVTDILASEATSKATGVDVEAGKREAIIDIDLTVMYGYSIPNIVQEVRVAVAKDLFDQVGLVAKKVNVIVSAIEFPDRSTRARVN